jgi:hypothetical protein
MYTPADRERIRAAIIERARTHPRITGGAITGSASIGREDAWSDIDLAFGVRTAADVAPTLADLTAFMRGTQEVIDTVDVPSGAWIYRVFLLANTLQVDLAFAPASDFGARAPTFRLVFGQAASLPHVAAPTAATLVGMAWLYALHVRSSLARDRLWQAEYMVSAMRDSVFALACLRHRESPREGRGLDRLPAALRERFEPTLVRALTAEEIARAFAVTAALALDEGSSVDSALTERIRPVLLALTRDWVAPAKS